MHSGCNSLIILTARPCSPRPGHRQPALYPGGCHFLPGHGTAAYFFVFCDPPHCEHCYLSYELATRSLLCSDDAIRRTELLQCGGLGQAAKVRFREFCETHVPNRRRETSTSCTHTRKQSKLSLVLAQCSLQGRRHVSDEHLPTPPGLLHGGESSCLHTCRVGSIPQKFF